MTFRFFLAVFNLELTFTNPKINILIYIIKHVTKILYALWQEKPKELPQKHLSILIMNKTDKIYPIILRINYN